jgi:hypothetical protein
MEIQYKAERSDVRQAYWRTWRSIRMNVLRALIFGSVFIMASAQASAVASTPFGRLGVATLAAVLALVLLSVYPMLRFKPDERTLRISPEGIRTTIGARSGEIPWRKVARIEPAERCTFIVGKDGNSFTIPHRAFASEGVRAEFLQRATRWLDEARRP